MGTGIIQPSFTSGELSPSMFGRIDFARYYTGLKTCRNFIVRQYGGIVNRPGTRFVVATKGNGAARLIPFQFSTQQTYMLEFGNLYVRIIKDGSQIVYPAGHPSAGQVVEVVTPYTAADLPLLKFTQSADVMTVCHPSYAPRQISRTAHHLWTLTTFENEDGPFQEVNVDKDLTVYVSAATGTVTVTASDPIFNESMEGRLMYMEQSPDTATLRWEVEKIIWGHTEVRAGANFYRSLTFPYSTTGTVRPSVLEGKEWDGFPGVLWEYLHSGFGIVRITNVSSATSATAEVVKRLPTGLVSGPLTVAITNVQDNGSGNCRVTAPGHGLSVSQLIAINDVTGTTEANGAFLVDAVPNANQFDIPVPFVNAYVSGGTVTRTNTGIPSYRWAIEAWGGANLYPGTVSYFQQRQVFGGSYGFPQDIWMSTVGGFESFEEHIPLLGDDSVTLRMRSNDVCEIRHFVDIRQLIALTSGGPVVLNSGDNNAITADSLPRLDRQDNIGCSHVRPVVVGKQVLYIQEKGSQIHSLGYSFADDGFVGNDLTILSSHLFRGHTLVDWAYQQTPFSCVWAVRDDGVLLGFTYLPEHEVAAWHRHDTDGYVEGLAVVSEGDEDAVYMIVRRTVGASTKRYIERLESRDFTDISDAFFVDSGLSYDGVPVTTLSGLSHLEGKTVSILADGWVHPQRVVTGGAITLDHAASKVHVGLPYVSDVETLEANSAGANLLDRTKLINSVGLIVEDTVTVHAGPDASNLREYKGRSIEDYGDANAIKDGLMEIPILASWSKRGRVFIRNSDPLPITILAVIPDTTSGGR